MRFAAQADNLLRTGVQPHQLLQANTLQHSNLANGQPDPLLSTADVVFGQLDPDALLKTPSIKWIHLTTAGYERYDRPDFLAALNARGTLLTNSSDVYAEACAQHALAMMLALARQLPKAFHNQQSARVWPAANLRSQSALLVRQATLLLGFGHIARRLVELLEPFHMDIQIVRRTPAGNEPVSAHPPSRLVELLPQADHVINLLPGSGGTHRLMAATHFAAMKSSAIYYSIGRGSTTDPDALLAALRSNQIAAAYLDVTDPEPLPPDHPLWTTPNCYITPHTAGGQRNEPIDVVQHFLNNLRRFTSGEPLRNRIV